MKTLKLFNAVLAKENKDNVDFYISEDGYIIEKGALWATKKIVDFYKKEKLNGNDLNKTFHKSWKTIKNSDRFTLYVEQIRHYLSTYGTNFEGEVYIPDEVLNVPEVSLKYKVIKSYTEKEMQDKCLNMLKSGIALKEETVNDLITVLVDELNYSFTGNENIRNKEANIKIADLYGIYPKDVNEFFRYILYKTTGETLLIKNPKTILGIKNSSYNPSVQFKKFGLEKLAEVFNRYKPLFLAYKNKCPKTINKLSKLSKTLHKPLVQNSLNCVTSKLLYSSDLHWLNNATPFALMKALSTCHVRLKGQDTFVYRIRNGKSWAKEGQNTSTVCGGNKNIILDYMKDKYSLKGKKFYFPEDVKFGVPTSEKMFVGNVPTGTKFYGKKMAVGVYWENEWGAHDIDLSGINIEGKIGWNSRYNQGDGELMYSGDMTNAPNGAVEYLYANKTLKIPTLVLTNVYNGSENCFYKIVVGQGDKISREYMMNPNNLFVQEKCQSVQKQTILGVFLQEDDKQCFTILNCSSGSKSVSDGSKNNLLTIKALYQQWRKPLSFNKLVKELGGEIVEDRTEADFDFSLDGLEKDSFMKVFSK
jgi:hypothetical protein